MNNVNINEKGRSMVEMLGVLAIIGVLSAGGLAGYSKAMFKHKLNNTIDQITMIVTNIRTLYGTQGNYTGLDNEMAVKAGIVPAGMVGSDGKTLTNPFKGGVTIGTGQATTGQGAPADTAFIIQYAGLPSEACVQIATSDFGTGAGSGFLGTKAGDDYTGKTAETKPETKTSYNFIAPNGGLILDLLFPTASAQTTPAATPASIDFGIYAGSTDEGKPLTLSRAIAGCAQPGTNNTVALKFY